ncbi:hypothetical protein GQ457_07G014120 [Hibiscus cannabinus]
MERAQEIRNQNQQATSLFVKNIPEKMEFANRNDALRAMERLNGFSVYGFRLTVKLANSRVGKSLGEGNYRIKEYAKGKKQENTDEVKAMKEVNVNSEDSSKAVFPVESDINCFAEDEALNVVFVGKDSSNIQEHAGEDVARRIWESIMSGYALKEDSLKAAVMQAVKG